MTKTTFTERRASSLFLILFYILQFQLLHYSCESFSIGSPQQQQHVVLSPQNNDNHNHKHFSSASHVIVARASTISNSKMKTFIRSSPLQFVEHQSIHHTSSSTKGNRMKLKRNKEGGGVLHRVTKKAFQNVLTTRLHRWSKGMNDGLDVQCHPCTESNNLFKLLRGRFQLDAHVQLNRIVFPTIQFSGGQLEIKQLKVNLWKFCKVFQNHRLIGPKYLNQFDFIGHNLTMTQTDLYESSCIRNGLAKLLTRILTKRGLTTPKHVTIRSITILENGKVSIIGKAIPGEALLSSLPEIPFEVRSGLGITSRGHVLTFPGLEISLTPGSGFFIPIFPELTIDLGHNAQINAIDINPITRTINVSAKITITPEHTMAVQSNKFQQSAKSFAAMCSIDVGRWITKVGQFAH